jgi:hypothetical protein
MPTPTYDLIATTTLAASSPEVVFGSIPQGYRDLVFVLSGLGGSANITLRYNGDSGSNYSFVDMVGNGSSTSSASGTVTFAYGGAMTTSGQGNNIVQIMDYSATDKHKTSLARTSYATNYAIAYASRWANTSAITSVVVGTNSGTFSSGHTLSLYGVIG